MRSWLPPLDRVKDWLPVLSLIVAGLAVLFGPLISLWVARNQTGSSLRAANKQILAPMRQQWIERLRDLIAEVTSEAHYFYVAAGDEYSRASAKTNEATRRNMLFLEQKIRLLLNPNELDHQQLIEKIRRMVESATIEGPRRIEDQDFGAVHTEVTDLARRVFKREWDRIKAEL